MYQVIAAIFAMVVGALILAQPTSADAAMLGPGYERHGQATSHLGGYLDPDGSVSYCINAGAPSAIGGVTTDAGLSDQVNGLSPAAMLRLNVVLSRHGNTAENNTAAAVAMAVWSIAGNADYQAEGGDAFVLGRAPVSERAAILALANDFRAEAAAYIAPVGSAMMTLSIDPGDDSLGLLDLTTTPASASGTITLTNAVFADSNSPTRTGVPTGAKLAIRGTPPSAEPYRVSAVGDFTAAGGPSANVHLYTTPGAQTLTASGTSAPLVFSAAARDEADRLVPRLTTVAQPTGIVGRTVIDTASAINVPSAGMQLTWAGYLQPNDVASPTCTAQTLVYSSTKPLTITSDGDYPSEEFPVTEATVGTIHWVETARVRGSVVAQGMCGAASETSVLFPAPPHLPVVSG
ncbi:hypothetical protein [Glaciihabitans sp. UYNi722]|uniref:hypothetical protein n=1 Tax=Glaciihabitans sp. UYNi722 TaxID=3156344 RepID=UPI003395D4D7